jgi:hypothetical protein
MKHLWAFALTFVISVGWLGCEVGSNSTDAGVDAGVDAGADAGSGGTGVPCLNPVVLSVDFTANDPFVVVDTVETGGASEMATWEATGGNPDGYRRMTHTLPSESSITVFHLFEQEYDPAGGAIDHINYSESRIQFDPPFSGAGIGAGFFLVQGGNRSTMPLPTDGAFASTDWEPVVLENIQPDDFSRVPDFTATAAPIQFGFYRSNSHGPGEEIVTTHGIDNWQVKICRIAE